MGTIRVVHCISNFQIGGTELNMVRTLERLDRREFSLSVIALTDEGPLRGRVIKAGIPVSQVSFAKLGPAGLVMQAAKLVRTFVAMQPDVVHCHDRYSNALVAPSARLAGVPLVISSRRWWTAMSHRRYRIANQIAYRLSHKILANSPAVARLMIESEGVPASRIVIVPNFVDDGAFEELTADAISAAKHRFGIPEASRVITAVAILRPEKRLDLLIEAVQKLRHLTPAVHLLIVGSGPCEAALRQKAAALTIEDRVHFAGFLASPPNPHQFGDMSVLCSQHEGFPNSIVEAMAAGKAVVATRVGGIPDAVEDGRTGILVPPGSAKDLAISIDRVLADDPLRDSMGRAAKITAREKYGARAVIDQLQTLYRTAHRPIS